MTNKEWLIQKIKIASEDELAEVFVRFNVEYEEHDEIYYENILTGNIQYNYEIAKDLFKEWLKEEYK